MSEPRSIAIDGPAGSGKSTLGEKLARQLGYLYVDTGAMYRAVAWLALQKRIDANDGPALGHLARRADIVISHPHLADGRQYTVTVHGQDITLGYSRCDCDKLGVSGLCSSRSAYSSYCATARYGQTGSHRDGWT